MAWGMAMVATAMATGQMPPSPGFLAQVSLRGLPPGPVLAMAMDAKGMLLIGTGHGLCRFDGTNLDLFRHVPDDSTSLPGNSIRCLLAGPDGRLWAGGTGLSIRDPKSGRFRRIEACTAQGRTATFECLQLWAAPDSTVWAACNTLGLMRYDPASGCLVPATGEAPPFRTNSFHAGPDGFWCTSGRRLIFFDPRTGKREDHALETPGRPFSPGTLFSTIFHSDADPDALWVGGWGLGLLRFNLKDRTFEGPFLWQRGEPTLTNIVYAMMTWGEQALLVATNSGLLRFDLAQRTFGTATPWAEEVTREGMEEIYCLLPATDGSVWVGGAGRLGLLPPQGVFNPLHGPEGSLAMALDPGGDGYWACRYYQQRLLMRLDRTGQVLKTWELPGADRNKYEPFNVLATEGNGVFIGTTKGVLHLPPGGGQVQALQGDWPGKPTYVTSLLELPDGSVLIGTVGQGFGRWDPGSGKMHLVSPPPLHNGREVHWGSAYAMLDPTHVLLGFNGAGIGVLDLPTSTIEYVPEETPGLPFLGDLAALAPAGDMLVGVTHTSGVARLRWEGPGAKPPFTLLGRAELPGQYDVFNDAVADDGGMVWIAGTSGLLRYDPRTDSFVRCGPLEGFPPGNVSALLRDGPGHVLAIGATRVRFDASKASPLQPRPGVYVRSWAVNGTGQDPSPVNEGAPIVLDHDRNTITLAYSAIDLLHADQLEYEVRLEGHDKEWLDNRGVRTVTYVALEPGTYQFAVRLKGLEGTELEQTIIIRPAFWQTWWFKVAVALATLLLVSLGTRYVIRLHYRRRIAELEREREVQRTRMRIARDIHDGIGGGLTRIALLSRRMNAGNREETAARIAETSTELVRELGEIVWTVNPENDTRSAFMAYVRSSLGRQFDELEVKLRLDLSMTPGEEETALPPEVKRNTVLILREAVNNALKHANASEVAVRLHLAGERLELTVKDNGAGFNVQERAQAGNGLPNLRKRAAAAGGTLTMDTAPGRGTTVHFTCPLSPTFM